MHVILYVFVCDKSFKVGSVWAFCMDPIMVVSAIHNLVVICRVKATLINVSVRQLVVLYYKRDLRTDICKNF